MYKHSVFMYCMFVRRLVHMYVCMYIEICTYIHVRMHPLLYMFLYLLCK